MAFKNVKGDSGLGHELDRGPNNNLFHNMTALFAKYDKEFPESDIIDLADLSIYENRGFLKRLPEKQTVWNSKQSIQDNPLGSCGRSGLDKPSKDLSVTALDLFHEEVISEVCQHEDIGETEESSERNEDEDFSEDTSSIASGIVVNKNDADASGENLSKNGVTEDEKYSSDGRGLDEAFKSIECLQEPLDEMERVRAWLKGKRKRNPSVEGDISSPGKQSRLELMKKATKDVDVTQTWNTVGWVEGSMLKEESFQEYIDKPDSDERVSSPGRMHDNRSIVKGDQFNLYPNLKALESPVRDSTRKTTATLDPESPSSRMLIESWKSHLNLTGDNSNYTGNKHAFTRHFNSSQLPVRPETLNVGTCKKDFPYLDTKMYVDASKCIKAPHVSPKTNMKYQSSLGTSGTKKDKFYSFSHQYLQAFSKNFCKRQATCDSADNVSSEDARTGKQKYVGINGDSKLTEGQVKNAVSERNKRKSVSLEHTYVLAESGGKDTSCNGLNSEISSKRQYSEPWTPSIGKLHNSTPPEVVEKRKESVVNDSCSLQPLPNECEGRSLLSDPFEFEEDDDVPSSFVPCHSSTMISSLPLAASNEYDVHVVNRSQTASSVTRKVIGPIVLTPKRKRLPAKGMASGIRAKEVAITDTTRARGSLFSRKETGNCPINSLSNALERTNSSERHSPNPMYDQQGIVEIPKTPSTKTCGGPNKCKKVFCLECCHSPFH